MKILNTLSGQKEEFEPIQDKKVGMFVCGPTVYDWSHIGHARTYVIFDIISKYLRSKGHKVKFIMNITDIDDKIIERARNEGKSWKEIADFFHLSPRTIGKHRENIRKKLGIGGKKVNLISFLQSQT